MFKNINDYNFRELVGHFLLMRNTDAIRLSNEYARYIDESVENIKADIIVNTREYYVEKYKNDDVGMDFEGNITIDALNEDMTTRKFSEMQDPLFGYACIEKNRGYVIYMLGNIEDKYKYVYAPSYFPINEKLLKDIEVEIIDDDEYEYANRFREQIQYNEETDEDIIKTRELKVIDPLRIETSPDFVTCVIQYNKVVYTAMSKLKRVEKGKIYAEYRGQEGVLEIQQENNASFLLFKPTKPFDFEAGLKEYIKNLSKLLEGDFEITEELFLEGIELFKDIVIKGFISGDVIFEVARKINHEIDSWDDELLDEGEEDKDDGGFLDENETYPYYKESKIDGMSYAINTMQSQEFVFEGTKAEFPGLWGIKTKEGVIKPQFLYKPKYAYNNTFVVYKGDKWKKEKKVYKSKVQNCGVVDEKGDVIVSFDYEEIEGVWKIGTNCSSTKYIANKNGKWGVISSKEEVLIPFEYESIVEDLTVPKYRFICKRTTGQNNVFDVITVDD